MNLPNVLRFCVWVTLWAFIGWSISAWHLQQQIAEPIEAEGLDQWEELVSPSVPNGIQEFRWLQSRGPAELEPSPEPLQEPEPPFGPEAITEPEDIIIPDIGIDAPLEAKGLEPNLRIKPTFGLAAWYNHAEAVQPGEVGPALIAGHVEPAVFQNLRDIESFHRVEVHMSDGWVAVFRVTAMEQLPKDQFPREKIIVETDQPILTLVTCGGVFNSTTESHVDNVIVYTVLDHWRQDQPFVSTATTGIPEE